MKLSLKDKWQHLLEWSPPENWMRIKTIDAHTAGEPLRVIVSGFPELRGKTVLEERRKAKANWDRLRTALMWEPRGHADMYGCLLIPPVTPKADFGVLFLHNEGFSTMCGHGIIAVTKVVLETGLFEKREPETKLCIDTPAGLVTAYAQIVNGKVAKIRFQNVPSFVVALDSSQEITGLGPVKYDLAFGGAFYVYVQAAELELRLARENTQELIRTGMAIKRAVMSANPIVHPFEKEMSFLYGTIFIGPPESPDAHSRNVCIFADGEVDRSPTGTGVSGRLAIHHARGEIGLDAPIVIESILGTKFTGRVVEETKFGDYDAVIPEIAGQAFLTGKNEFWLDPNDSLKDGFLLR